MRILLENVRGIEAQPSAMSLLCAAARRKLGTLWVVRQMVTKRLGLGFATEPRAYILGRKASSFSNQGIAPPQQ